MSLSAADVRRMANALQSPGIDPRTWITLAVVSERTVDATGVHVAITTMAGLEETATVAPLYGGRGFGLYAPIAVGSTVVVAFPEGEPNTGGRVIGTCWDQGDPPPDGIADYPDDFLLVIEPGHSCRVRVSGGGDIMLAVEAGKVKLGAEVGTGAIMLVTDGADYKARLQGRQIVIAAEIAALAPGLPGTQPQIDVLNSASASIAQILAALGGWPVGALKVEGI